MKVALTGAAGFVGAILRKHWAAAIEGGHESAAASF
eukprot:SAG31_NODE_29831_length_389_cov_0.872414_1_plen_35_part_01